MNNTAAWRDFRGTHWRDEINVRDFIQNNYTPYEGDEGFLAGKAEKPVGRTGRQNDRLAF